MSVAPPPARQTSPGHRGVFAPGSDASDCSLDEPLSWDHFAVEVVRTGPAVVVRCRGGLDFAYTDQLRDVFAAITDRDVVVDLRRLTFVDSTGLSVLLSARRALLDVGGSMSIRGASGLVRRVFEAAELADVLED
ncbi:MAG TPA: STAS domain-containing protein [Acidimicrobiales bacterium]|nr:STAS domain-containing protein [Acidimicrobiales bacterium]